MKKIILLSTIVLAILLAGVVFFFAIHAKTEQQPSKRDPAGQFKSFTAAFVAKLQSCDTGRVKPLDGVVYKENWSNDYSIDVHTTDSLVSPYIGTIDINWQWKGSKSQSPDSYTIYRRSYAFTFAAQDNRWILKGAKYTGSYHLVVDGIAHNPNEDNGEENDDQVFISASKTANGTSEVK